jgi:hypothetical protein
MAENDAIARLARQIGETQRAERLLSRADQIGNLRRQGAQELHRICGELVSSVNDRLSEASLELSPSTYSPDCFRDSGTNVFQISSEGRQMQIVFEATRDLVSTAKFAIPYIAEGEVRTYNQRMLERFEVRTLFIFLCVEDQTAIWRYFDWRTSHTGVMDPSVCASLMEPLF